MSLDPQIANRLRHQFKYLNKYMLLMWRLGLGSWFKVWPQVSGQVMVITHIGRKSGVKRYTPVNYAIVDGELYCTSGFGRIADWYRNIKANPNIEVWLPEGWWAGFAEEVTDQHKRLPLMRQILIGSGFAAFVFGINPYTITDQVLNELTSDYRLLRIKRTEARTGPGGPGDLAWVWPIATVVLLLLVLRPRGRVLQRRL
jgi:deazaflavin-dependent oxidoreductase (nitroreductase family)